MVLVDPAGRTATDPDCAEGDDTCVQEKGQPKKKDQSVDVLGTLGQALDYIGSETSQRLSNLAQDTLQVIQNVRRDPNCAVNLTAGGFAAGAGFGFYTGGFTVGTAGALAGSLELPGFGTFSGEVGGLTVGATGGGVGIWNCR